MIILLINLTSKCEEIRRVPGDSINEIDNPLEAKEVIDEFSP